MPARTAEEVHELFAKHFSSGDLESLLALYEPTATLVPGAGPTIRGLAAIREAMTGFLAPKPQFELKLKRAFQSDDIALLFSTWTLKGTDETGDAVERAGQTSDVVRRQPDGTWLLVIDIPYGAEAADD